MIADPTPCRCCRGETPTGLRTCTETSRRGASSRLEVNIAWPTTPSTPRRRARLLRPSPPGHASRQRDEQRHPPWSPKAARCTAATPDQSVSFSNRMPKAPGEVILTWAGVRDCRMSGGEFFLEELVLEKGFGTCRAVRKRPG